MQIIAILRVRRDATEEQQAAHRTAEVEAVWAALKADKLRDIRFHDGRGAILTFETSSKEEAQRLVDDLPMVRAGLLDAELLALQPFTGFEDVFAVRGGA